MSSQWEWEALIFFNNDVILKITQLQTTPFLQIFLTLGNKKETNKVYIGDVKSG